MSAPRHAMERSVRVLAGIGVALFVVTIAALFVVQETMSSQQQKLEAVTLPVQQGVADLDDWIATAFARESEAATAGSEAELEALGARTPIEQGLTSALSRLTGLALRTSDPVLQAEVARTGALVTRFLEADADVFASMHDTLAMQARFRADLERAHGQLREEILVAQRIAGRARLARVLSSRQVQSGASSLDRLLHGPAGPRADAAHDLALATQRYATLVVSVATISDADSLNAMAANELPQARTHVLEALEDVDEVTSSEPELAPLVATLSTSFGATADAVDATGDADSLLARRRALFSTRALARTSAIRCATTMRDLVQESRSAQASVVELATRAGATARTTATATRVGSVLLALAGMIACVFAARRLTQSVAGLRATNHTLTDLQAQLESVNEGLERVVAARTEQLAQREKSLQHVLDATGDGLISVDLEGRLLGERSNAIEQWFGYMPAGQTFIWHMLFPDDAQRSLDFQVAWEQLAADILPFALGADQMPVEIERDDLCFALGFKEVRDGQKLTSILVTLEDVTERAAARHAAREAQEAQAIFASLLADARGFGRALTELKQLLRVAGDDSSVESARRALHTLKGNAAVLGLRTLSERCHEVEDRIAQSDEQVVASESDLSALEEELARVRARVRELAGDDAFQRIEVATAELSDTIQMLERGERAEALARIRHWMLDPVARPLGKLAMHARRVACDLGKNVAVVVVDGGVRVDADSFEPIWSALSHAVSNAVDHGIEPEGVRIAHGKTATGHIVLSAQDGVDSWVTVEVSDDGAGIDLDAVRIAALRRGLPCLTRQDLLEALFADELTTRAEVTQTSGRGVGLAALRETCARLGGHVEIETERGVGTRLRVRFPGSSRSRSGSRPSMRPRAVA